MWIGWFRLCGTSVASSRTRSKQVSIVGTLPISLRMAGRLAVVVGSGPVGLRKMRSLWEAGANIRAVSWESPPAEWIARGIAWRTGPYSSTDLEGASLVVAAGPASVNAFVVADARERGIWVCDAANPDRGDFTLPAVHRSASLTVAVDTAGAAPLVARQLRDRVAVTLEPTLSEWVDLLAEMRPLVLTHIADPLQRRVIFRRLADWSWMERLSSESRDVVRNAMLAVLSSHTTRETPL
ncbi:MAG: bifunctional precorrin-2 dehydrogenase/sirohydrochlorin ferrochelatase [Bacteroidales bacterium]|nr:bifunctional precorrin-2 dehydrogenase/sirohydrochlorin ferrochelatase [Bacteroidales bacterium]